MRKSRALGRAATPLLVIAALYVAPFAMSQVSAARQAAAASPVACNTTKGSCWVPGTASIPWQYQLQSTTRAGCLYPSTNYINTGIKTTAWNGATNVAPKMFDIDIYQDPGCSNNVANIPGPTRSPRYTPTVAMRWDT